jgi:hypothetical protein
MQIGSTVTFVAASPCPFMIAAGGDVYPGAPMSHMSRALADRPWCEDLPSKVKIVHNRAHAQKGRNIVAGLGLRAFGLYASESR